MSSNWQKSENKILKAKNDHLVNHILYKKYSKNVYISPLGTEISQNYLSILK